MEKTLDEFAQLRTQDVSLERKCSYLRYFFKLKAIAWKCLYLLSEMSRVVVIVLRF